MRRVLVFVLVIAAVGTIAYFGGRGILLPGGRDSGSGPVVLDDSVAPQEAAIVVNGQIVPVRWIELAFGEGGKVAEVSVHVGDVVPEDQLLAQLEVEDLTLALRAAQQDLELEQARLTQAEASASKTARNVSALKEIAAAEAELASARASLAELLSPPDPKDVEEAWTRLEMAVLDSRLAQASLEEIAGGAEASGDADAQRLKTQAAKAEMAVKLAELDVQRAQEAPGDALVRAAEARVARAEARLTALQEGASKSGLRLMGIQVAQASTRLAQVQANQQRMLEDSRITAPYAGVVVSVDARPGEYVGAQMPVVTLADTSEFRVQTTDLDEWDLKRVRIGELLDVQIPGLDNRVVQARVIAIAPRATRLPTGDVGYTVTLAFQRHEPELRWGMSVRVGFPPPTQLPG